MEAEESRSQLPGRGGRRTKGAAKTHPFVTTLSMFDHKPSKEREDFVLGLKEHTSTDYYGKLTNPKKD
jgi:hypothetical protein